MDRILASYPSEDDGDLVLCHAMGAAYQKDRTHLITYDAAYHGKCVGYDGKEIENQINAGRISFVNDHIGGNFALDVGVGSGIFLKKRGHTYGFDVNPVAIAWLQRVGLWREMSNEFAGYTFWDVLEHIEDPGEYFRHIRLGAFVFTSLPIFDRLEDIRRSRHYRPGEHLQYFSEPGFIAWMAAYGFQLIEGRNFETVAGRDSIYSYAFKRYAHPVYARGGRGD